MTRDIRANAWRKGFFLREAAPLAHSLVWLSACAALAGCGTGFDDEPTGAPTFGGVAPTGGAAGAPPAATGSQPTGSTPGNTSTGATGSNGAVPTGMGAPISNGAGGTGNTTGSNTTSNTAGAPNVGSGGQPGTPSGAAGSSSSAAGSGPLPSNGGSGGAQPPEPTGPDIDCPAGASFCSGFEGTQFPAGTQFHSVGPGTPNPFAFDSVEVFAGEQSLVIPATNSGGFFYRALAVPVPAQDFWVRLYMHLSTPLGDNSHDSVFGASSGGLAADVNGEALVELSEQFNEILLNTDDALFNPPTTSTLAANTWLCMEAHYNGATGDVQIFADGNELMNAPGYRPLTYQTFRIGYMRYNDDRTVRYDDVIVAPNRVNCD